MSKTSDVNSKVDFALVLGEDKIYDFEIDENGDFYGDEGFDSSIRQDVDAELRESDNEQLVAIKRHGSLINEVPDVPGWMVGSKLYFYNQARATIQSKNGSADAMRETLSKYVPVYLQEVIVTSRLVLNGIQLETKLVRLDGKVDTFYFNLWEKTGTMRE